MCLNRRFGFSLISILGFMFLQEAFVLIIRGLIMRCPSKEGKRQWGNKVGPCLNVTILKIPTRKNHAQITRCCKEEGFSPPLLLFYLILGSICIFFPKGPGSGNSQASSWQSLAEWHCCQVQDNLFLPLYHRSLHPYAHNLTHAKLPNSSSPVIKVCG